MGMCRDLTCAKPTNLSHCIVTNLPWIRLQIEARHRAWTARREVHLKTLCWHCFWIVTVSTEESTFLTLRDSSGVHGDCSCTPGVVWLRVRVTFLCRTPHRTPFRRIEGYSCDYRDFKSLERHWNAKALFLSCFPYLPPLVQRYRSTGI